MDMDDILVFLQLETRYTRWRVFLKQVDKCLIQVVGGLKQMNQTSVVMPLFSFTFF